MKISMFKKLIFLSSALAIFSLPAMYQYQVQQEVSVTSWKDLQQFAGQIVVYRNATTSNFTNNSYPLGSFMAGYVRTNPMEFQGTNRFEAEMGYAMSRLKYFNTPLSNCAWTNSSIEQNRNIIVMREATSEEKKRIIQALNDNDAEFDHSLSDDEIFPALTR